MKGRFYCIVNRGTQSWCHQNHGSVTLSHTMSDRVQPLHRVIFHFRRRRTASSAALSRPPTATPGATFLRAFRNPTDSNSSSVGSLEVHDQCHLAFHSCFKPTSNLPITLLPLRILPAPAHHTPTSGLVVQALTAAIWSTGMTACVTSAVSTSRGIARHAWVSKPVLLVASYTFRSPVNDVPCSCRCRDSNIRWKIIPLS